VTTKLGLINAALLEIGHTTIADTGEAVESGRIANLVYDQVVVECLSAGSWNFAMETIKADADTGVVPNFGFTEVFAKPSDFLRTIGMSADEYFAHPMLDYYDDQNFWSADSTPIYIRYVSDDTGLGLDLTRWPPAFTRYVELEIASRICPRLTESEAKLERIAKDRTAARKRALNYDAMDEPQPKFAPMGSWNRSRSGRLSHGDRGSRSSLTE
jgi:hypothetical protein